MSYDFDALNRMKFVRENGATSGAGVLVGLVEQAITMAIDASLGHNVAGTVLDATVTRNTTNSDLGWWTAPTKTQVYVADGLNRYSSVNGTTHTYDTRGNLTSDGSRTFVYDVENRLTSVSGTASMTLTYDPLGRLRQTVAGPTHDAVPLRR